MKKQIIALLTLLLLLVNPLSREPLGELSGTAASVAVDAAYTFRLPLSLVEIETEVFEATAARHVQLPESLHSIGARTFSNMTNLRTISVPEKTRFIAGSAFDGSTHVSILGTAGSYAQAWALRHGFRFQALLPVPVPVSQLLLLRLLHFVFLSALLSVQISLHEAYVHCMDCRVVLDPKRRAALRVIDLNFP